MRSENVGTSNRNPAEIAGHRKPKVSLAMTINQGLGGPKGKPNGVPDGQPVNIPAHSLDKLERTKSSNPSALLDLRLQHKRQLKCYENYFFREIKFGRALFLEKFRLYYLMGSVPQTNTGG